MKLNLRASDKTAQLRAYAYLDARDKALAPYLAKYPGRLPRKIARLVHQQALKASEAEKALRGLGKAGSRVHVPAEAPDCQPVRPTTRAS